MVTFDVSERDAELIKQIALRFRDIVYEVTGSPSRLSQGHIEMDLRAAHASGRPLDLDRLLQFDRPDFLHDVAGITQHLDRKTGHLTDFFVPRCGKR